MNSRPFVYTLLCGFALLIASCSDSGSGTADEETSDPGALTAIAVTPASTKVNAGETVGFTAMGTYEDDSQADLSDDVDWYSSFETVATIAAGGTATGVDCGATVVTALEPETVLAGYAVLSGLPCAGDGSVEIPDPLVLGTITSGTVGTGTSYYQITLPGTGLEDYEFHLTGLTDDADLALFSDPAFSTPVGTCFPASRTREEMCQIVNLAADTPFYVAVDGAATVAGTQYDLVAFQPPDAETSPVPPANEGSVESPIEVAPHIVVGRCGSGQVGDAGQSYYRAPVLPGWPVTLSLQVAPGSIVPLAGNIDLGVYADASFTTLLCESANAGSADESCAAVPPSDAVWLRAASQDSGSYFLWVVAPPEGSADLPIPLAIGKDNFGTVDDSASYYAIPITPGNDYQLRFLQISSAVTLNLHGSDATFGAPVCSEPWVAGSRSPTGNLCLWTADGNTLYLSVDGADAGAFFRLSAELFSPR